MKNNKILGIDFGESNVGLAVTDPGANLVFGKGVIKGKGTLEDFFGKILEFCKSEQVGKIVFGLPMGKTGEETKQTERMRGIGEKLKKYLKDIPVFYEDESFTSFEAREEAAGFAHRDLKKKYSEHEIAAMLILKRYLKKHPLESSE